jgi:hypothetical protein
MRHGPLSAEQLAGYERAGFLLVDAMFDAEEIGLLLRSAKHDRALDEHSFAKDDGEVRLSLWNHPGEGIYGMFARCRRIADACEQILLIREVGIKRFADDSSDVAWLDLEVNVSARSLAKE